MPFPLAHPAAVLPFRRYCPKWLNLPALIIGSLIPDLSYCTDIAGVEHFAHRFWGSFGFALPTGLAAVWVFYLLRKPLVRLLPEHFRNLFLPVCEQPAGPLWGIGLSIVIGAWTHILLDSVSHRDGWLVESFPVFLSSVGLFLGRKMTLVQISWFAITFTGAFFLSLSYLNWFQRTTRVTYLASRAIRVVCALVVAGLTVGLGLVHRLVHHPLQLLLIITAMMVLAAGFVWVMGMGIKKAQRG
jgi:hypothetical protein